MGEFRAAQLSLYEKIKFPLRDRGVISAEFPFQKIEKIWKLAQKDLLTIAEKMDLT
jgi:hypothetical protein